MTMKTRLIAAILSLALLAAPVLVPGAPGEVLPEYQLKAVFLYNFGKYTSWPAESFTAADTPIVIGILGRNPFGAALAELGQKNLQNRPVLIRQLEKIEEARSCHILFISLSERHAIPDILPALKGSRVLTVSDIARFARSGGMIELYTQDNRVRFDVNLKAARKAGIDISSNLLKLATTIVER